MMLAALLLAAAQPGASAAFPEQDIVGRWGDERITGRLAQRVDPLLSDEDRRLLQSLEFRVRVGPVTQASDPCFAPARFAYVEPVGAGHRVNLCMRNVMLFSIYTGSMSLSFLVNSRYQSSDAMAEYIQLVTSSYRTLRERPRFVLDSAGLPCSFPEFLMLKRTGADVGRCAEGNMQQEFQTWTAANPDFFSDSVVERMIRGNYPNVNRIANLPGEIGAGSFALVYFYFMLHEAAHVRLDRSGSGPQTVCSMVRREYAADEFARRLLIAMVGEEAAPALRFVEALWIGYQAIAHLDLAGDDALGLDFARTQATMLPLLDDIARLPPELRAYIEPITNAAAESPEQARQQLAALRTCLNSDQPFPDGPPPGPSAPAPRPMPSGY